jgi:hypothetical protein
MLIPEPFHDELSYGHVGRISYLNGWDSILYTRRVLRMGTRRPRTDAPWLSYVAEACGYCEEEYLARHTIGPLLRTVLRTNRRPEDPALLPTMLRMSGALSKCGDGLYCPQCVRDDIRRVGVAYWHRVHNLPGITWCVKHGVGLWVDDRPTCFKLSPEHPDEGASHPVARKGNMLIARYVELMRHFLDGAKCVFLKDARQALIEHMVRWPERFLMSSGHCQKLGMLPALPPPWDFVRLGHIDLEDAASLDRETEEVFRQASAFAVGAYGLALAIAFPTIDEATAFHANITPKPASSERHYDGVVDDGFWGTLRSRKQSKHAQLAANIGANVAD